MGLYWEGYTQNFLECSPKDSHGHLTAKQRLAQQDIPSSDFKNICQILLQILLTFVNIKLLSV